MAAPNSKVFSSPYTISIPNTDIATFVFTSGTPSTRQKPQYFDALNPSKCFSLSQAETYVKRFARGLQSLGLQPDDKILLYSNNRLFFPVLLWGVVAARCVFTAAAPAASVEELEYQLRDSGAKVLITNPETASTALKSAARVGLPKERVYLFCDPDEDLTSFAGLDLRPWTEIWSSVEDGRSWSWERITSLKEAQSTTAIINYSSGTTGLPKGVELSHYNSVANSVQLVHKRSLVADTSKGRARKERLDMSGERWLAPLPMYHVYGQTYYCMNAANIGAKVFIMPKFNVQQYLLFLDIYRITFLTGVPVILTMLTKQLNPSMYNLKAIESVVTGSAPLSPDIGRLIAELYLRPGVTVNQGIGMTETTCSLGGFTQDETSDGRSVGWLHPNCQAKIMPIEDRDFSAAVPDGQVAGELWVSGPNVMKGYFRKPEETAKSIVYQDGYRWLRTGDVAYIDEKGHIFIVDRLKELIKVKGLQVAPAELELVLQTHPDVADAAVMGAKIDGGEYPRAFVVRKKHVVSEEELKDLIKQRLAPHKWLTAGVFFIDAIPRTGSGKIIRRALPEPKDGEGPRARSKL